MSEPLCVYVCVFLKCALDLPQQSELEVSQRVVELRSAATVGAQEVHHLTSPPCVCVCVCV